ncbi:cytochrome c oxidase subunit 10 [Perkinsela sp. CCAP 1560/4]|nr:cytochrome c oxidase subunit 10 [Perkinsela sp. CCAP 1560/4]|eukprot:KNH03933.1 cytochrome c oxidase subunit 10 [Perkinsela sp. CCAP 1560/4]
MWRRLQIAPIRQVPFACTTRQLHFPLSAPPLQIKYLDEDPLEYALQQEARHFGFDDTEYTRELAFVRINDNPTVGQFRQMNTDERASLFYASGRPDFYTFFTWKVLGKHEHLYHYRDFTVKKPVIN